LKQTSLLPTPENQVSPGRQTALILKALLRGELRQEEPLAEIQALSRTAGLEVKECLLQRLERPHPATYLGKGKVEEAAGRAGELDIDVIITDNDLSPAQERNLEKATGRTVVDRSQLIMDIFAQRAKTHQAKLQVELAQLRYSFPRLKRLWTHLSRYEGGIGMRGPGETQLETDKRLISGRIQRLSQELEAIQRRKESSFLHRRSEFVIALVGYTNAGKSTLLNRLTGSEELVEDKLFATLDTRVRRWAIAPHRHVLVTDTVGFIRDLPHHLVASFHATLAETREADILFHVVDASSLDAPQQMQTVREVLRSLDCHLKPTWLILNKWDAVSPERLVEARHLEFQRASPAAGSDPGAPQERSFHISAQSGLGIEELRAAVHAHLKRRDERIELDVPHSRGDVIAYVRENAEVLGTEYRPEAVHLRFSLSPARAARLRSIFPEGFGGDGQGDEDGR
jgi:GTP-binding protein HflX